MASGDEAPLTPSRSRDDSEWEAQRELFTKYYIEQNLTLKVAAKRMRDDHQFVATERQWERRVNNWGLKKYENRQDRLRKLEDQGRTLIEVANPGRTRKYSHSKNLTIDDRNMRRFARRELIRTPSRSRSRSESSSVGRQSASVSPSLPPNRDALVIEDRAFDLDLTPILQPDRDHVAISAHRTEENTNNLQAHVMTMQDPDTGVDHSEMFLAVPLPDAPEPVDDTSTIAAPFTQQSFDDGYSSYPDMVMSNHNIAPNALTIETDMFQGGMFSESNTDVMKSLSPHYSAVPGSGSWQTMHSGNADPTTQSQSFDQIHSAMSQTFPMPDSLGQVQQGVYGIDVAGGLQGPISAPEIVVDSHDTLVYSSEMPQFQMQSTPGFSDGPLSDIAQNVLQYTNNVTEILTRMSMAPMTQNDPDRMLKSFSMSTTCRANVRSNDVRRRSIPTNQHCARKPHKRSEARYSVGKGKDSIFAETKRLPES
jgi:hypothetical protein